MIKRHTFCFSCLRLIKRYTFLCFYYHFFIVSAGIILRFHEKCTTQCVMRMGQRVNVHEKKIQIKTDHPTLLPICQWYDHLTHNAHIGQNQLDNFGEIFQAKAYLGKYLKEKYLSEQYQQLTLHHIFCKIILNYKVIPKSILDPDDNCWRNS